MINESNLIIVASFLIGLALGMPLGLILFWISFKKMMDKVLEMLIKPLIDKTLSKEKGIKRIKEFLYWRLGKDWTILMEEVRKEFESPFKKTSNSKVNSEISTK